MLACRESENGVRSSFAKTGCSDNSHFFRKMDLPVLEGLGQRKRGVVGIENEVDQWRVAPTNSPNTVCVSEVDGPLFQRNFVNHEINPT
jgi:hypothetical protein